MARRQSDKKNDKSFQWLSCPLQKNMIDTPNSGFYLADCMDFMKQFPDKDKEI
jgi:hypothetical protein